MAALIVAGVAGAGSFASSLFKLYAPREFCMAYETPVIWLHVLSDAGIALAYYSIPIALVYFVRERRDLSFSWMFVCFALFIFACGTTHVMNIVAMWFAAYRLDGLIKFTAALVSIGTAVMLWPLIPRAVALPSPAALRRANDELGREVEVRRQAEDSLRQMQVELEERVQNRTTELQAANQQLRAEVAARAAAEREREDLLNRERQARTEAEQASRMKDEFLATLSHELRTPLNAIYGWAHILRQQPVDEVVREGIGVIERNARTQTELIDDLLDMSRIASGLLRLNVQSVDLTRVIDAALETVAPAARARDLHVQRVIDPRARPVTGDPARLQQVVWNLVNNAIKFTPRGGHVQVHLEQCDAEACVRVSDTGAGIAPDFLPFVFDRFRQGDSTITRRHGGLGLGLAIVRQLVELHGGSV